ncbi:nucleoid-associated protein [Acinetobacter calcoaceticus]|uniref:nucleoid-associated protein n=1 Tax=Acinetobacter calcoaceticus TaxID=471 RepID=UPI00124E6BE2|nr:nucleoid-associated protein [Acinetobacter calcoaceticus]
MYDISSAKINKVIIHQIGNKFREEGIILSNTLMPNEEKTNEIFLRNFFKPILSKNNIYNFFHESDINLNEIYNFSKKIIEDRDSFIKQSQNIAKCLHSVSTHPNILSGELIIILFKDIVINKKNIKALGIYKTELKENYFSIENKEDSIILNQTYGIPTKIQKGALILEDGSIYAIDTINQKTKYWFNDFLKINLANTPKNNASIAKKIVKEIIKEVENPKSSIELAKEINYLIKDNQQIKVQDIEDISQKYVSSDTFNKIIEDINKKEETTLNNQAVLDCVYLSKITKKNQHKIKLAENLDLIVNNDLNSISDIEYIKQKNGIKVSFLVINKQDEE